MAQHSGRAAGVVVWVLSAAWALVTPALGQGSSMSWGLYDPRRDFTPQFGPRDLNLFQRVLGLKPQDRAALDSLYEGYVSSLRTRGDEIREIVITSAERAETMHDSNLLHDLFKKQAGWDKEAEVMQQQFLADLKSLLNGEQEGRWPIMERELRRLKSMPGGHIAGEKFDVTRAVDGVLGTEAVSPLLAEVLEHYAQEVDRALTARDEYVKQHEAEFGKLQDERPADAESMWKDSMRLRIAVRELNVRYTRLAAEQLPATQAAALQDKLFESLNERVMSPTHTEEYVKEAGKVDGLSASQRGQVDELAREYAAKVKEWQGRAGAAERESETQELPRALRVKLGRLYPGEEPDNWEGRSFLPEDHPIRKARRDRFELDAPYRARLNSILTPEQRRGMTLSKENQAMFCDFSPGGL